MPKVSVCLAVYKTKPEYLKECIESILNQTFTDFEFLIVDDCPEDKECEKIIKSYEDNRIKYYRNEKNLGISGTRNRLLDLAQGEYIAVMDHDDISLPTRLEKQVAYLDAHPECGVVSCWYERFPNLKVKKKPENNKQIINALRNSCSILHPAAMIRKSVLFENNLEYEEEFSPSEDYALWCRLADKTEFYNIPEVLFRYRDHETNESKRQYCEMCDASQFIKENILCRPIYNGYLDKPILVVIHIYYPEQWPEIKQVLKNIVSFPIELRVTMVENHQSVVNDIQENFSNVKIELVPNKGYDIAPFVSVINQVNLDNYSLIVKLHTKRDMPKGASFNYWDMSGKKWREYALSMLKTPIVFAQSILSFQQDERLGMVANYHLIANKEQDDFVAQKKALNLLKQLDLPSKHYSFVAGTMFVCRANLFKPLQKLNLNFEDFAEPEKNHSSSLAHVIERLLGCLVVAQGYSIKDVFSKKQYNGTISRFFRVLRNFIYQKKENKKGLLKIKLFRIPVFVSQMHKTKERVG